jgi:S-DNA-T family DNA segregation ATPase FtsK/SpoIIIE
VSVRRVEVLDQHGHPHHVFIDADASTPVGTLADELDEAGFHARPLGVDGQPLSAAESVADLDLAHGSLITCGQLAPPEPHPTAGVHVVVVCGPDAGASVQLPPTGSVVVGRSAAAGLRLDDPLLSSQHCRIDVDEGDVTVTDLRSTNGTFVEAIEITEPAALPMRSYFQIGSSVLAVVSIRSGDLAVVGDVNGPDRVFPRQYRRAFAPLPKKLDPPKLDAAATSKSSSMWWRALLPLGTGVGFAVMSGRWQFLLLMALAPVAMAVTALQSKKRKARQAHDATSKYEAELAEFHSLANTLRAEERDRKRAMSHCGGVALLYAAAWHRRLWERAPGDDDFLGVPVGLATVPSTIEANDPEGILVDDLWGTPIETNLLATGSLGIVGPLPRARAAARGIVMNLIATHSPADMRVWVLTRDELGECWGFTRWLPHTFAGPQTSLIAADGTARAALLKSLKQLVDTRAEVQDAGSSSDKQEAQLPINVVVIDGADLLEPGELTDLLRRGPELGIVGVTIDSRLAPEGVGASLKLTDTADEAIFDSRHHPRTEGIIVPEVDTVAAERAARRLAPLRPSSDDEGGGIGGVCHLVEIDGLAGITAEQLVGRWGSMSPHMIATVGMASELPMHVDLINDGPHGLIGGTSGSGKTEFLKTMFVSLCLNNHPDDLSIVVVDFKGGVDHDAIRPLPHVVDVATNLDIEQFKRTIAMLNAEQKRRQALLSDAGANNVVSYRAARSARPDLPPLPRLLVVVDEFGELLAAEGGREQLKELESITRIGRALGLHLLLVTQNFEGNLPGQIDANAGLRVSLRVQKPAHSKAVLNSGVAATIPDRRVGRAYARFHGRDLIEFQTARVAGRRRELEPESVGAEVRVVPFAALASQPAERRSEDVPNEETDMYALVQRCREAAALTGWTRSAVPWPAALPAQVSVQALARQATGANVPIGLIDVPEQQRRETGYLDDRIQQLAVIGGSSAPVAEVLTTYGATLALMSSPDDVHIYGIDLLGRSLAQLADLPHCGGVAVRNEQLALRIVRWMLTTAAQRKVDMASSGSSNIWEHAAATGVLPPQIVLLVSGVDRILSVTEDTQSNLRAPLTTLMSEGVGVRFQVVLGGLPRVVGSRLGSNVNNRLVLEIADPAEYAAVGAHRSFASDLRTPRRAVWVPDKRLIQLAQLAPTGTSEGPVIQRLAETLPAATHSPPHRFADVPWPLPWEIAKRTPRQPAPSNFLAPVPVAVDTNSGDWCWIDAIDDGPLLGVVGPPKSGRSTMLGVLARMAAEQGWGVLNATTSRRSPLAVSPDPVLSRRCDPAELGAVVEAIPGRLLVLVDDLQRLDDISGIEAALQQRDRVLVAVAAPPDLLAGARVGALRGLPQVTTGVLLAPTGALEGQGIGLKRLPQELTSDPRPGRGLMALAGEATEIQVPLITFAP